MERYSEYKDSGVQWLGEIPSHWEIVPLKFLTNCLDGKRIPLEGNSRKSGPYPYWGAGSVMDYIDKYIFDEELVLLGEDGAPFFDPLRPVAHYVNEKVWINNHIHVLKVNKKIISKMLVHALNTVDYTLFIKGSILTKLNQQNMNQIKIAVPPISEQQAITSYLDKATSKIDEAIAQQQKMIDLLNERKQIIINNAVTKGLDPNVKMKDSGVDWIGEIPENWVVRRGKFLFKIVNEYSTTGNEELLTVSDRTGITPRSMKNVNMFMSESLLGYKKCKVGDICSNIMWMWHGAVGVTKYEGVISPSYGVYRQRNYNFVDEYLDKMLRLPQLVKLYAASSTGLTESRLRLYPDDFMNIPFFVPPISEQNAILSYLEQVITPIDNAIDAATKQIFLLQERKQIIINDVVTGKVKV